jgi:hypothetical protein
MGQPEPWEGVPPEDDGGATVARLGPPGWDEFSAARQRFMRTVAVAGLESAWEAAPREPRRPRRDGRP